MEKERKKIQKLSLQELQCLIHCLTLGLQNIILNNVILEF